ncbi:STAS domain-containing protein [Planomonospora sp. ID67723]|uniref:STAS domain-containing protein n=1 Tax=Planomonospora sp. ID67723 TaxID=2738134 RepID=UPI0018C42670|nr:STAS domain-containing protein [Planomonospora sp. ID67723]MBG0826554.1 STAS domain-containing protein [Planomonospora sp. ID67723]
MITVFSEETRPRVVRITAEGDLDAATSGVLRRALDETCAARVELDLSRVAFLDCAGARSLLWADTRVRKRGGTFAVVDPSTPVVRLLGLLGLDRYLSIEGVVGAGRAGQGD